MRHGVYSLDHIRCFLSHHHYRGASVSAWHIRHARRINDTQAFETDDPTTTINKCRQKTSELVGSVIDYSIDVEGILVEIIHCEFHNSSMKSLGYAATVIRNRETSLQCTQY